MARQAGPLFITGTIDDMVFYQMNGRYYMRLKGEPTTGTKKRMSQDEHYPLLCLRKREFKEASKMVRKWYYTLPKTVRKHGLFGKLTGKAVRMLRKGMTEEKIKALLLQEFGKVKPTVEQTIPTMTVETDNAPKLVSLPAYTPPKPKRKSKKLTTGRLSSWQVSEQGQLQKEVVKPKAIATKQDSGTSLYATQGYYSTWTCSGW
ncbi:hypothetical protein [Flavisolibacter tropicus]|uniref:Uncharacterized protein n=1 Tax=Flavisolibacter tropicus TaxID=1492898 RepID=A0A172U0M1_9BACT|nr:hypothetical protein [Flavisolibacter tropicus]ANE52909.1 hypothetical protein SY85_22940 [Flavisolibacter tropicus]